MKNLALFLLIISLVVVLGCATVLEHPAAVDTPLRTENMPPAIASGDVEERIYFLEKVLQREDLQEQEKETATDLLKMYSEIDSLSQERADCHEIIHNLLGGLKTLEQGYFSSVGRYSNHSEITKRFADARREIFNAYHFRHFDEVVEYCIELQKAFGPEALTPEIGLVFALALAEEGNLEEASNIAKRIAPELRSNPDQMFVQVKMCEWALKLGRTEDALLLYDRLAEALKESEAAVLALNGKIEQARNTDNTSEKTLEDLTSGTDKAAQDPELIGLLREVDDLMRKHEYDRANFLLTRYAIRNGTGSQGGIIEEALDRVAGEQERFETQKMEREAALKTAAQDVKALMEEEKYQEAIAKLESIERSPGYVDNHDLDTLKIQAIESYINQERNRAARFFLKARTTNEPDKKEAYLRSSYEILKSLIEKYPSSPLREKIESHISTVEDALEELSNAPRS